jgi:hypothetical protein
MEEWLSQFAEKKNLTLRIREGCYQDQLAGVRTRGHDCPEWLARLAGKLFPSPDLLILLDLAEESVSTSNQAVIRAEMPAQLEAYRSFITRRNSYVILDASRPPANIMEEAYAAIIDALAQRTDRQLKKRF